MNTDNPNLDAEPLIDGQAVVLFDGVCNLCNGYVNFLIDHDPKARLKFAALQSDAGGRLLAEYGQSEDFLDSIVLIESGQLHTRSGAVLRIARRLNIPWKWLYAFIIIPTPLRDLIYKWVAARRYRWFGKQDTCRMPTPELQARFLT